MASIVDPGSWL